MIVRMRPAQCPEIAALDMRMSVGVRGGERKEDEDHQRGKGSRRHPAGPAKLDKLDDIRVKD